MAVDRTEKISFLLEISGFSRDDRRKPGDLGPERSLVGRDDGHACFNTNGTTLLVERDDYQGDGSVTFGVRVKKYLNLAPQKGVGIVGQPQPPYFFHRALKALLGACFAAGMALEGLEEPAFTPSRANLAARWDNCGEIPPILAARLRVLGP